jgi:hypothetical protein
MLGISSLRYKLISSDNNVDFLKNISSIRSGLYQDCFNFQGKPTSGSFTLNTTIGLYYNSSSLGALEWNNKTTGSVFSVSSKTVSSNIYDSDSPFIILYDRLWGVSIDLKSTSEQLFTEQSYSRYDSNEQLFVWIEIIDDTGSLSNDSVATLKYIDKNNVEKTSDTNVLFRSSVTTAINNCDAGNLHFLGLNGNDILKSVSSIKFSVSTGASSPNANLVVGKILNILPCTFEDQTNYPLKHGIIKINTASCLSLISLWQEAPTATESLMSKFKFIDI